MSQQALNFIMKQYVDGAYKVIHPETNAAQVITDASMRFVTDAQIAEWTGKQAALGFTPENVANKNKANGYAGLDQSGKILVEQLPSIAITDTFEAANEEEMLALQAQTGDICIRTDLNATYILAGASADNVEHWKKLQTPTDAVSSVNGRTGAVVITLAELGGLEAAEVVSVATANKVLRLNGEGKLEADVVGNAATATKLATARQISITGDATAVASFDGSANASLELSLANTGVTAGEYTKVKVDAKGRVTQGSNIAAADLNTLTMAVGQTEPEAPVEVWFQIKEASTISRI